MKGLLRCDARKESLSKKKSTVKKHISSSKHVQAKNDLELSKKNDKSLLHFFKNNDAKNNAKGEALPHDMRVYRFDLVQCFLSAGIPLSKVDSL